MSGKQDSANGRSTDTNSKYFINCFGMFQDYQLDNFLGLGDLSEDFRIMYSHRGCKSSFSCKKC